MTEKKHVKKTQTENDGTPQAIGEEQELVDLMPVDEIENLREALEESQSKAQEYLDGWQRARADFANYKKRVEREQAQAHQNAAANIFKRFLDVLDDLDRALKNRPQEGDMAGWSAGIELVYRKFLSIIEAEGVTLMQSEGEFFDPNLHEALSMEENKQYESGQIIEVVKNGYMLGDRVLRPALVRVAK
jgi:molecular chaperone GrpE